MVERVSPGLGGGRRFSSLAVTKSAPSAQYEGVSESDRTDSFDALYAREFDYVYRTLGRLGVFPADIPDAVHEVFVVVYRRWSELDTERGTRPWLFGIARRVAAAARRKMRPDPAPDVDLECAAPPHAERDLLWQALAAITAERREVLVLHDLEGHTGAEIARILDIPANTVHSRLRLARADIVEAIRRLRGDA